MTLFRPISVALSACLLVALAACGASNNSPGGPSGPPAQTITITAAGASPRNVQVSSGDRVRFVNSDNRAHNMTSDPHPDHNECPEINNVGILQPGQARETLNLIQTRTCGFHDHDMPNVTNLTGQIVIR